MLSTKTGQVQVTHNVKLINPVSGKYAIADLVISQNGFPPRPLQIIEVKTGSATLSVNQVEVYDLINSGQNFTSSGLKGWLAGFTKSGIYSGVKVNIVREKGRCE